MSEDRTQAPSRRRRQEARERGVVARSGELTAAVGLIAAVALLGARGGELGAALVGLVRAPLEATYGPEATAGGAGAVAASLRSAGLAVALPLGIILGGSVAAMVLAHMVQTGGLWAPALLAPDPARLGARGGPSDPLARVGRAAWGPIRAALVVALAAWLIRRDLPASGVLASLEPAALAGAAGAIVKGFAFAVGLALLGLGVVDYALSYRRVEALLLQTPEQQREERKAEDGDPALRARRRRLARDRIGGGPDPLAGAALLLAGDGGLAVVLAGDPPPGRVTVRLVARGASAAGLRRAAARAGLPTADAPELAAWFAAARGPASAPGGAAPGLPAEHAATLARLWPAPA